MEASSKPDTPLKLEADKDGVPVSVRYSSNWEAMTTLSAPFLGVPLMDCVGSGGVYVSGAHTRDLAHHTIIQLND